MVAHGSKGTIKMNINDGLDQRRSPHPISAREIGKKRPKSADKRKKSWIFKFQFFCNFVPGSVGARGPTCAQNLNHLPFCEWNYFRARSQSGLEGWLGVHQSTGVCSKRQFWFESATSPTKFQTKVRYLIVKERSDIKCLCSVDCRTRR